MNLDNYAEIPLWLLTNESMQARRHEQAKRASATTHGICEFKMTTKTTQQDSLPVRAVRLFGIRLWLLNIKINTFAHFAWEHLA